MLYSKGCEYVIRAFASMKRSDCKGGFSINALCERAGVPVWFTRKMFQSLVKHGILATKHGPGGGYYFKRDPKKLSLLAIIAAVDGDALFTTCILGRPKCDDKNPCSVHSNWEKMRKQIINRFDSITLDQLMWQSRLHSHISSKDLSSECSNQAPKGELS